MMIAIWIGIGIAGWALALTLALHLGPRAFLEFLSCCMLFVFFCLELVRDSGMI